MSRLVFFKQFASGFGIPGSNPSVTSVHRDQMQREGERLDFRSPSLELAKIQVSPGFLPNREPSGSVLITCSIAFPTSPEPPVTRITSPLVMISRKAAVCVGRLW